MSGRVSGGNLTAAWKALSAIGLALITFLATRVVPPPWTDQAALVGYAQLACVIILAAITALVWTKPARSDVRRNVLRGLTVFALATAAFVLYMAGLTAWTTHDCFRYAIPVWGCRVVIGANLSAYGQTLAEEIRRDDQRTHEVRDDLNGQLIDTMQIDQATGRPFQEVFDQPSVRIRSSLLLLTYLMLLVAFSVAVWMPLQAVVLARAPLDGSSGTG